MSIGILTGGKLYGTGKNSDKETRNAEVLNRLLEIKEESKRSLAAYLKETQGLELNENSIFDMQSKRLHEYKRQQMNVMYAGYFSSDRTIAQYNEDIWKLK